MSATGEYIHDRNTCMYINYMYLSQKQRPATTHSTACSCPTYAAVRGGETLAESLLLVWQEVKDVMEDPTVLIKGHQYNLTIVFGADYKV